MTLAVKPINSADRREIIAVALLIVVVLLGDILVCRPRVLLNGPFWLDECLTDQIVEDPSIGHAMAAVRHGVDTNPPAMHLIDRVVWRLEKVAGLRSAKVGLRLISLVWTAAALLAVYALLRRSFSGWAALAGVAAVWAHPAVVEEATNARFYSPWLAMAAVVCLLATADRRNLWRVGLLAIASALLCTIHYFGILSLGLIAAGVFVADSRPMKQRLLWLLPMMAGPIALLPFLPWIHDQSAGLSVKTWLDPFTFWLARSFLEAVLAPLAVIVLVGAWVVAEMLPRLPRMYGITPPRENCRRSCVPLFGLVGVPILIVIFSATVQSALRSRYGICAALALAPLAALIAARSGRAITIGMLAALSVMTILQMHGNAGRRAALLGDLTARRDELRHDELPMIFAARSDAVELQQFAPELPPRIEIADEKADGFKVRDFRRYETDMVRKVAAWYPHPPLITAAQIGILPAFHLVSPDEDLPTILLEVPMHPISGDVYSPLGE